MHAEARQSMVPGDFKGLVVGYLGGVQRRKGYQRLIPAIEADPDLFLLMAGPYSGGFTVPSLGSRYRCLGILDDLAPFYAACDVLVVPSLFEPLGLVAFEAAARGAGDRHRGSRSAAASPGIRRRDAMEARPAARPAGQAAHW